MQLSKNIIILGGDLRQKAIYKMLNEKNFTCTYINSKEKVEGLIQKLSLYDVIILPVPISHDDTYIYSSNKEFKIRIFDVIDSIGKNQILIGGAFKENLKNQLETKKINYFDFYDNEDLILYNAHLTAQGALKLLLDHTDEFIKNKRVLITGYGRIAKALADVFDRNRLDVYICVRNSSQKNEAICQGYKTIEFNQIQSTIHIFDFIFNTVPSNVFDDSDLNVMQKKCLYFELASPPYGVDKEFLKEDNFILGNALPGRFLSSSAGEIIFKTIEHLLV